MIGGFAAEVDDRELYLDTGVCVAAVFGEFDVFVVNHGAKVIISHGFSPKYCKSY